jgi:hypothetical protein
MLQYAFNLVRLINYSFVFTKDIEKQKHFYAKTLLPIIDVFKKNNDGSLTHTDFKRIRTYATLIPAVLGESFVILRGRKTTDKERLSITFLGSITGLFDDLFDNKQNSPQYIKNLLDSPELNQASNSFEKLLIELYQKALINSAQPDLIKEFAQKLYFAQVESQKQFDSKLTKEELKQITFEKGGVSIPLYRCAFNASMHENEYKLLYFLGAIGQLENDIFDIYKDYTEGISTLATSTNNIFDLQKTYESLIKQIFDLIENTTFHSANKLKFKYRVSLIVSRGLVGIAHLKKITRKTNGRFEIEKYSKKDLICDLEKPTNLLKLVHYAAICMKK